ncbi:MAG TPA: FliH/SctL family protein [Bryobacteraceae bacterium]|nr:FliH/SctL family protein [Bryobacteraceae bacterium]
MSSEIVTGSATPATPVLWRKVSLLSREKPKRHSARRDGEEELKSRLDQARREGMEQGREAGLQESEQQVPAILQNFARAQAELAGTAEQIRIETARDLVQLARNIAARVIHREMVTDSAAVAGLVRAAFSKLQQREITRVRMHPAMEPVVTKTLEDCGAPAAVVLAPDTALSAGELLFETSQGVLDASLETQLRELERGLMDKLGKAKAGGASRG